MYEEPERRAFYAVSHENDQATVTKGSLIPAARKKTTSTKQTQQVLRRIGYSVLPVFSLLLLTLFFSSVGYAALRGVNSLASPIVMVQDPYTEVATPLQYGVTVAMTKPTFVSETRNALIEDQQTFIELDLSKMQLRFFEDGVLSLSTPIIAKGEKGTVWETPAGFYKVADKQKRYYSSFSSVYLPWCLTFEGNLLIHGWPTDKDGNPIVNADVGGIRIDTVVAESLFAKIDGGTPIIVYDVEQQSDNFLYEPKVPELQTPHYLLADLKNNTVLASSDLDESVPIASLTKLMTAVVAVEELSLDEKVWIQEPSLVQTLIPRLQPGSRVPVYSLLQLLLVESSNEAAEALATAVGRGQFIDRMNEKAASLGLRHSQFADPSGLSNENLSSVGDLLRLIKYIADNRQFLLKLTANQHTASAYTDDEFGELMNFNQVAGLDNFVGGKVGETEAAGQTSISLHQLTVKGEQRTLVIVLLGSASRNTDVTQLLEYAKDRFAN